MPNYGCLLGRYSLIAMCFVAGLPAKSIAQESSSTLDKVTVIGERAPPDYRTEDVKIGPLRGKSPIDTPYSIDVVPDDLSQNQQLKSVREVFRYLPSVQGGEHSAADSRPAGGRRTEHPD
jgi:iron complex outermembrane recepter protein